MLLLALAYVYIYTSRRIREGYCSHFVFLSVDLFVADLVCNKLNLPARSLLNDKGFQLR